MLDDRLTQLLDGDNTFEFFSINLVRRGQKNDQVITGRGFANLLPDTSFEITLVLDDNTKNLSKKKDLVELKSPVMGSIYLESEFYNFEAVDIYGNVWVSERFTVGDLELFPAFAMEQITFTLRWLHLRNPSHASARSLTIECKTFNTKNWYPISEGRLSIFLKNIDQVFDLYISCVADVVRIKVISQKPVPIDFEFRLTEAFGFVFDENLDARRVVRDVGKDTDIIICKYQIDVRESMPVLLYRQQFTDYYDELTKLLQAHLTYCLNFLFESVRQFHPLTYYMRMRRDAEPSSIDVNVLLTCIIAEGVVDNVEIEESDGLAKASSAKLEVLKFVEKADFDPSVKERISGALNRVGQPSAKDKFYALIKSKNILKNDFKQWDSCRHKYAHLSISAFTNIDNAAARYQAIRCVNRLILHIILFLISYKGLYIDYAENGFPIRCYPPS